MPRASRSRPEPSAPLPGEVDAHEAPRHALYVSGALRPYAFLTPIPNGADVVYLDENGDRIAIEVRPEGLVIRGASPLAVLPVVANAVRVKHVGWGAKEADRE